MKKRILLIVFSLALLLSLAACQWEAPPTGTTAVPVLDENCAHRDADSDNYCDNCRGFALVELDLLALNDLHGKFLDSSIQPGVDELTTYLLSFGPDALLLSSGDMWQGSSESNLTQGKLMTDWMNSLDFAAMTLGNHEFDWGEDAIRANQALADFPFLAINIYDRTTNTQVSYCQSSVLVEREGVTIGIIGAIGDCYSSISGDKTEGIYFKTGYELTELVKEESTRLRSQGADIIVYSIHDGHDKNMNAQGYVTSGSLRGYYDTSLSDGYVDIVFEGHAHKRYVFTDEHGVCHLQGGGENAGLSHAQITYNLITNSITQVEGKFVSSDVYDDQMPHLLTDVLLDKYQEALAPGNRVVGTCGQYQTGEALRQLIAQLYYEAGIQRWGSEYDIALGGGFISIRNPWNMEPGQIRYSLLQSLFPFDNQIVLCSVKGHSLLRNFYQTSNENYFVYYEDYGQQVLSTIDPNGTYYIVTDTYCSSYGPNELTIVAEYDPGIYARDLLADYISQGHLENDPIPDDYALTDIATLLRICGDLAPGEISQESYFTKGNILSISSTKYGNMTIEDENGDRIYIYGLYSADGTIRYDGMENPPQVGDTVILWGRLQNYVPASGNPVYEMIEARLLEDTL